MSTFGQRLVAANALCDAEFGDILVYEPMKEIVNARPISDTSRTGGDVRSILLKPGVVLGSSWGLTSMHDRSSAEIRLYFMARGLLTDVRRFDRFTVPGEYSHPDQAERYEVADGPRPIGFGRHYAVLVQIELPPV